MRYFAVLIALTFISASSSSITKLPSSINSTPQHATLSKPKITYTAENCERNDHGRDRFQLKAHNHTCVLRGPLADNLYSKLESENLCNTLENKMSCPSRSEIYREIGFELTELISCAIACIDPSGNWNGPFFKVFPRKRQYRSDKQRMKFESGRYKNNTKTGRWEKGVWTCEKCEPQVRKLSSFRKGKKHGPQTEWDYNGKVKKNETYSKGELIIKEKYSRGKIETSTEYSGKLPLIVKKWGGNGRSVREYQWPNSRITFYNHRGDIYETGFYGRTPTSGISVKTGVWKTFHTTGIVSSIRNYNKKAELHGIFRSYYRAGALRASGSYKDGAKIGTWHFFRKDGGPKGLENYDSRGVPNGKFCQWNDSGKRIRCTTFINGTGKRYRYSYGKNKQVKVASITSLVNNKKHGKEITFKRGKKYSEVEWRNGKKHGLSIQYFAAHIRQQYKNGKREGKSCRSTKSSLWYGEFCDDKKCGTWFYQKPTETVERSYDGFGEEKYPTPKDAAYECPQR